MPLNHHCVPGSRPGSDQASLSGSRQTLLGGPETCYPVLLTAPWESQALPPPEDLLTCCPFLPVGYLPTSPSSLKVSSTSSSLTYPNGFLLLPGRIHHTLKIAF